MQKNIASQQFVVFAFNATTNLPLTGDAANITATISKDFAADVATNDVNPTETQKGFYVFDATQAETNADEIQIFPSSVTANIQVISVPGLITTVPVSFGDDIIQTADNDTKLTTLLGRIIGTLAAGTHNPATAAEIGALNDWLNGNRLDLLLDAIPTTAMRGTDNANTVVPDAEGVAPTAVEIRQEMDTNSVDLNTIIAGQVTINNNVLLIPTTPMRGTDGANTVIPPSVAQFNARTRLDADYFSWLTDPVAKVTLVDNLTTYTGNTPQTENHTAKITAIKSTTDQFAFTEANQVDANILAISGDTLSADNAKLGWNGVGVTGDNLPATQAQLANITPGAGGISTPSTGIVITTGLEAGAFTDTFALDGIYNILTPSVGATDFYYESNVGNNGVATSILWEGYVQSNNDIVDVYAWDWVGLVWVQIDVLAGSNAISPFSEIFILSVNMTGTGANQGLVRVRFDSITSTAIATDRILFEFTSIADTSFIIHAGTAQAGTNNTITLDANASNNNLFYINSRVITTFGTGAEQENIITNYNGATKIATVKNTWGINPDDTTGFNITPGQVHSATQAGGYENGKIYVNIANGFPGTQIGVNGTSDKPSSVLADARTIADSQNIRIFDVKGAAAFSLDQTYDFWIFDVVGSIFLDLNGQDISGSAFMRTGITGVMTATSRVNFELCGLINVTVGVCSFLQCGFDGITVLSDQDRYLFWDCFENSPIVPIINVSGDGITPTIVEIAGYNGRLEIQNMTSVDLLVVTGDVQLTLNANCSGGTMYCSGDVKVTDNSGNITFISGVTAEILSDTSTTIPGLIDSLQDLSAEEVNAEIIDVLTVDTFVEVGFPGSTASIKDMLHYTYSKTTNKLTQTATTQTLRNSADTGNLGVKTVSDDGTTYTQSKDV